MDFSTIAPAAQEIAVGADKISIRGLSMRSLGQLFYRFPQLFDLAVGKEISVTDLATAAPDAFAAAAAASIGNIGDAKAEAFFDSLAVETQADIWDAIVKLTFPGGYGPFVERVAPQIAALISVKKQEAQASNSPLP